MHDERNGSFENRDSVPVKRRALRRVGMTLVLAGLGAAVGTYGQTIKPSETGPIRIHLRVNEARHSVGEPVEVEVRLTDSRGEPIVAPKALAVAVQFAEAHTVRAKSLITLRQGEKSAVARITPESAGIVELSARHPELLDGGLFLQVGPAKGPTDPFERPAPQPRRVPSEELPSSQPREDLAPSKGAASRDSGVRLDRLGSAREPAAPRPTDAVRRLTRFSREIASIPTPTERRGHLELRASRGGRVLANGRDAATIQAFLVDAEGPRESPIDVTLVPDAGRLDPIPLRIPETGTTGVATLTSSLVGEVTVEYLSSNPTYAFEGDRKVRVHFAPAVHHLAVAGSPPRMTLFEPTEVVATLMSESGKPIPPGEGVTVSFAIDQGRGSLHPTDVRIPPDGFSARTTLTPTWRGPIVVSAATSGLLTAKAKLVAILPVLLVTLSLLGGGIGGSLEAAQVKKWRGKLATRTALGVAAGFVLYWLAVYAIELDWLPRPVVVNPVSALAIAIVGGWLGAKVFELGAKKLGFGGA